VFCLIFSNLTMLNIVFAEEAAMEEQILNELAEVIDDSDDIEAIDDKEHEHTEDTIDNTYESASDEVETAENTNLSEETPVDEEEPPVQDTDNLLLNPGFENDLTDWEAVIDTADISIDNTEKYQGDKSLKIE